MLGLLLGLLCVAEKQACYVSPCVVYTLLGISLILFPFHTPVHIYICIHTHIQHTVAEKLRAILVGIKHAHPNEDARVTTCFQTLLKMVGNVARAPHEEKFRRVRLSNPVILEKVVSLDGSVAFLEVVGFEVCSDDDKWC